MLTGRPFSVSLSAYPAPCRDTAPGSAPGREPSRSTSWKAVAILRPALDETTPFDRFLLALGRLQHRLFHGLFLRLAGLRSSPIEVAGVGTRYLHGGSGPPLVLLHGFGDQKETWSLLAPFLARRFHLYAPDLPGYGDADEIPVERASFAAQAEWLEAFLDQLGLERVHLAGNSMGGGISVRFAYHHPDRVASMALLCAFGPRAEPSELDRLMERGQNPLFPVDRQGYDGLMAFLFARRPYLPRAMRRYLASRHARRHDGFVERFDRIMHGPAEEGIPAELESIRVPALVIHGLADRALHPSIGRAYAQRLPDARGLFVPGVGHVPQWEMPRKTLRAMRRLHDRAPL